MSPEQTPATPPAAALDTDAPSPRGTEAVGAAAVAPEPPAARSAASRRSLALMLLLAVAGATLLLVGAGRSWVSGHVQAQGVSRTVTAQGGEITGLPGAMALVALASVVAVFAVRGPARRLLGALVALAGAGAVVAAVGAALGSESGALDDKAARSVGLSNVAATSLAHSAWPWLAALGGVLVLAAGALTLLRGGDWPGMSARYDAPAGKRTAAAPGRRTGAAKAPAQQTPADLWKALDRGEDPTAS